MLLNRIRLSQIATEVVIKPAEDQPALTEKVLQFGTGVLLRGLCDYYIDKANRNGIFNGSVVVIKSTSANVSEFSRQDNLYTICVRGQNNGNVVSENIISSCISRVLPANGEWSAILQLATESQINIVISNTTEVGLQLLRESIFADPPESFPAKLVALLYQRFKKFGNADEGRMIIVPTELIPNNGDLLRAICLELARHNNLGQDFIYYLTNSVLFCNSLVDRIVTKDPGEKVLAKLQAELGYEDELLTMCEDYHLWAIQGNDYVRSVLSFADGDGSGAFVKPDIEIYRALKLHLLNGTHTLSAPLAFLAGFNTVKEAMHNPPFREFVAQLMLHDISSAMPVEIPIDEKVSFGRKVLERFSNPFLDHLWLNITFQQSMKMRTRNLPIFLQYQQSGNAPLYMAKGFAAYLLFMKAIKKEDGKFYGERRGVLYRINDDKAGYFFDLWQNVGDIKQLVKQVLSQIDLWEHDLSTFAAFSAAVENELHTMQQFGAAAAITSNSLRT